MELLGYIENYFYDDSERTILINGEWGSGKTYYIKNYVLPKLKTIDEPKKNIIYISLSGIATVDELINKIISSKLGLGDKLISGLSTVKGMLDIGLKLIGKDSASSNEVNEHILKFMNFSSDFIIFDDLERLSKNFLITDFLGFVNTYFIEHNSTKVLFIADESKIHDKDNYYDKKEKMIEHTYHFELNIETILNEYIEKIEAKKTKQFFNDYRNEILSLLKKHKLENLRTVFYIFKMFSRVIPVIYETIDEKKARSIILFIISISIEVKKGNIKSEDNKKLNQIQNALLMRAFERGFYSQSKNFPEISDPSTDKEYYYIFIKTYIENESIDFQYYNSLFKLIINGYIDDAELANDFSPKSSLIPDWELSYQKMIHFRELKEEECLEVVKQVYRYALEKKYDVSRYGNLYHWLNHLSKEEILKISTSELERKLIKVLNEIFEEKGISINDLSRERALRNEDNPIEDEIEKLMYLQEKKDKCNEIAALYTNFNDYKLVADFFNKYKIQPIINKLNISKLSVIIKNSEARTIKNFKDLILDRFKATNIQNFLSEEKDNISLLSMLLSRNNISKKKNPLKKLAINELIEALEEIHGRL